MKKIALAAMLAMSVGYVSLVRAESASYNAQTGMLYLPTVTIGNATYYNINVLLNPSAFGNGWLVLPDMPECMKSVPITCTDTQPQLISLTITGPDKIPEGTSATYYAQSQWYRYYVDNDKIIHEIVPGSSKLTISLSGSNAATISGDGVVTAKLVSKNTDIVLSVYDNYKGVVATATKVVQIVYDPSNHVPLPQPIVSTIPGMRDLYPGSVFTLANGQQWIMSSASTTPCILPGPPTTSDNPKVTIYYRITGTVMDVEGDATSCPVEQLN